MMTSASADDHEPDVDAVCADIDGQVTLTLLGGFRLHVAGEPVAVAAGAQRLAALLALKRRPVSRREVAGTLWPQSCEKTAGGCLRTALWRMRRCVPRLVIAAGTYLELSPSVCTDIAAIVRDARRLLDPRCAPDCLTLEPWRLAGDLLPGWYDDWVVFEQERFRQLCLHAMDALAARLLAAGRHGAAMDAAYTAIRRDPFRESAQRLLVQIHLAEANTAEARRSYDAYAEMLRTQLGIFPSAALTGLVAGVSETVGRPIGDDHLTCGA
jgi:DNA-binding SARP family transcriptional activator